MVVVGSNVTNAKGIDLKQIPSIMELSVYSGISKLEPAASAQNAAPGDSVMVKASGWAYAGGGRKIVRVDLTGNGAETWTTAALVKGGDQPVGRAWAWTFWEADVPAIVQEDGSVAIQSKAVDSSMNSQPETCEHTWNVRGLMNKSWFKKTIKVSTR